MDTHCKTYTYPTGCKHGHDKLFSVSEDGKCVRLKDRPKSAKRLGMTVEDYEQNKTEDRRQQEEAEV